MKRSMLKSVNSVGIPPCCSGAFVIEPHASGYPHFHVIVFAEIPEFLQEKIKQPWPEKCQVGSNEQGVDFSTRIPDEDINSLRNYPMKYIAKGFVITDTKFFETFWTKEIFVFNALIGKNGYQTFQPSRRQQQGMSYNRIHDSSAWWHTGESEFESNSPFERQRYLMWERFRIPEWLPFRELN